MTKGTIFACCVCLLIGGLTGWFLALNRGEIASIDAAPPMDLPPRMEAESSVVREEFRTAESPSVKQDGLVEAESIEKRTLNHSKEVITVPTALISELSLAAGTRSSGQDLFQPDDRIEEILEISDYEKARVQTAWVDSRRKVRELEASSAKIEPVDEWSVRVIVPDLSQKTESLGEQFRSQVNATLGENRGETFLTVKQVDQTFSPPEGEQSYVITTEETGDGGWRYRFELDGPSGRRVWVGESIPENIRHLTDAAKIQPLEE